MKTQLAIALASVVVANQAQAIYLDVTHHDPQWLEFRLADNQWSSPFDGISTGSGSWAYLYAETWPGDLTYTRFVITYEWDFSANSIFGQQQADGSWSLAYGDREPYDYGIVNDRLWFRFEHPWQRVSDNGSILAGLGLGLLGLAAIGRRCE